MHTTPPSVRAVKVVEGPVVGVTRPQVVAHQNSRPCPKASDATKLIDLASTRVAEAGTTSMVDTSWSTVTFAVVVAVLYVSRIVHSVPPESISAVNSTREPDVVSKDPQDEGVIDHVKSSGRPRASVPSKSWVLPST